MGDCSICALDTAEYKCPKCEIKYCSINCFKKHKNEGCEQVIIQIIEAKTQNYNHITEDTVPIEKLKLLNSSNELKNILSNPHVRDILLKIDKSENVNAVMDSAMKEPIFTDFVDECLKIIQ